MNTFETRNIVFNGTLRPAPKRPEQPRDIPALELCRPSHQQTRYSVLTQSRSDLEDQQNSPSISMWPYLLTTAQTQHLNQISIYVEQGTTAEKLRFLYMNDVALRLWGQMGKPVQVIGRLRRPPRGAVLSFGMPFSE